MQRASEASPCARYRNVRGCLRASAALVLVLASSAAASEPDALLREATEAFLAGRFEQALSAYQEMSQTAPGDLRVLYNVAVCKERLGRGREALAVYRRVLAADPGHARAASAVKRLLPAPTPALGRSEDRKPALRPTAGLRPSTPEPRPAAASLLSPTAPPPSASMPAPVLQVPRTQPLRAAAPARTTGTESLGIGSSILLATCCLLLVGLAFLWLQRLGRGGYAVQGLIRQFPVADVLQILAQHHKTGILLIQTPRGAARLYIDSGNIAGADMRTQTGVQAIHTILSIEEGSFIFRELGRLPKKGQSLKLSIEHALLNWAYQEDETRRAVGGPPAAERLHRN